ncbi:tRNA lysidine(34) synthetase TilS [Dehalogenimonas sp. THU2]|uniref:tRNA lysidine(34) synthetase TilS n=1 Tax=Dehalogenimonas sp. THU2 TaxID=3151121 RepID=UPI003218D134
MHRFEKKIIDLILRRELLSRGDRVVVAVSGGADSVSLLHTLHNNSTELDINLHVAHLDHGLRGIESDADAEFVRDLAGRLGLPSTIEKRDVQGYRQEHRLTLEEAAREVRYAFLAEVAGNIGAVSGAVAHTRSDHVETVLLHLLRGSGLSGLVGLKEASILRYKRVGPLRIIRPLIGVTRAEVEAYCREAGIDFRTDATNESLTPTRNRIRRKLLPDIREDFNPRIEDALVRLSRLAADDLDFIEVEARRVVSELARVECDVDIIDKTAFSGTHPALQRGALRLMLLKALGGPKDIEAVHIEDMLDLASGEAGRAIDLPGGLVFASGYRELYLGRDLSGLIPFPPLDGEYKLNILGVTEIPGWKITASIVDSLDDLPECHGDQFAMAGIDLDMAGDDLTVRTRRPGDAFQPMGMDCPKKLKDFFIDSKVPRPWRDRVPIVVNPRQIVWVAGYRLDERVRVTTATRRVLNIGFFPGSSKNTC